MTTATLTLSASECEALKKSLDLYLMELRRETAHTESRDLQHALAERQRRLEAILERLA